MSKNKTELFEPFSSNSNTADNAFVSLQDVNQTASEFIPFATAADPDLNQNLQDKADLLEQEAYEKGFEQGEKDGFELGEKKAAKTVERIESILSELTTLREDILKHYEKDILDLVYAIAGKVVHFQIAVNENIVKDAILEALNLAGQKNKVVIRVNPEDYDFVENARPELFTKYQELKSIIITSDHSVSRGGCFIQTPSGDVDARVEAQLEKIYQSMQDTFIEHD